MDSELELMLECAERAGMTLEELTAEDLKFWSGDDE
jgi:hypothetical protein